MLGIRHVMDFIHERALIGWRKWVKREEELLCIQQILDIMTENIGRCPSFTGQGECLF